MFMNSNLFEPGKTKPEKQFIQLGVKQSQRFDGRRINESRDVVLTFGADWGSVAVSLSGTKILAQVSCEIGAPLSSRPNDGKIQLNVSIGGVAFLDEVQTTHDQRFLTLNSLLERTFRNSRCLDVESLCIAAEQHVWCIRVEINVLNHDGNLYDACTIASLAALMHFRRPEVTFADGELRIYTDKERELVPLLFHHYPVSSTYCIFKSSSQPVLDPTLLEENAADSVIVLSFNSYQELCTLNAGGTVPTSCQTIMQCAHNAADRSKAIVDFIRKAIALDEEHRQQDSGAIQGLSALFGENKRQLSFKQLMNGHLKEEILPSFQDSEMEVDVAQESDMQTVEKVPAKGDSTKTDTDAPKDIGSWLPQEAINDKELQTPAEAPASKAEKAKNRAKNKANKKQKQKTKQNHSDSEEEVTLVI